MIRITIRTKNDDIVSLNIKGHAESGEHGNDLVCAGVSSIAFGLLNALEEQKANYAWQVDDNEIEIVANNLSNKKTQIILKTGIIQFQTIRESYKAYIKIRKQEV